jgi:uncharacterized protein
VVAAIAITLVVGSMIQGVVGLGLGLVGAPVVALLEPALMPGLMLLLAMLLPVVTLWNEREGIDWSGLAWALPLRVPGTAVGVWLVAVLSDQLLGVAVGVMVLAAVVLTARAVVLPLNRASLSMAGFVSGITGTATSIGGPPLAILYQHQRPRVVRTTLAVYFVIGAALSIVGLLLAGEMTRDEVLLAGVLLPTLVVGALLARPLRDRLAGPRFRAGVLIVCAVSALVLLGRSLA